MRCEIGASNMEVLPEIMSVYTYVININYKVPYLTK
jgi:hypothetical protein